jgi:hypothetical protein
MTSKRTRGALASRVEPGVHTQKSGGAHHHSVATGKNLHSQPLRASFVTSVDARVVSVDPRVIRVDPGGNWGVSSGLETNLDLV